MKCWAMRYDAIYQLTARSSESVDWLFRRSLYGTNYRFRKKIYIYRIAFSTIRACAVKTTDCTAKNRLGTSILVVHRLARRCTHTHISFARGLLPRVLRIVNFFLKFHSNGARLFFVIANTDRLLFCSRCTQKKTEFFFIFSIKSSFNY